MLSRVRRILIFRLPSDATLVHNVRMKIKLHLQDVSKNPPTREVLEIESDYCLIGRANGEIALSDPRCSKQQAILYQSLDGLLKLRDLDSTNGTFVNGNPVTEIVLNQGDEIRIGKITMILVEYVPVKLYSAKVKDRKPIEIDVANASPDGEVVNQWPAKFSASPTRKEPGGNLLDFIDSTGTHGQIDLEALKKKSG